MVFLSLVMVDHRILRQRNFCLSIFFKNELGSQGCYIVFLFLRLVILKTHQSTNLLLSFRSYNSMDSCDSPEALPDCDQIILSCGRTGNRSGQAAEKLAAMGHTNTYELGEQNLGEIILAKKGFARDNPALPEVDSSRPAVVKSGKISIERL